MEQRELDNLLNRHEVRLKSGPARSRETATLDLSKQDLNGCVIEDRQQLSGLILDNASLETVRIRNSNG